jgi:hypothetical protein
MLVQTSIRLCRHHQYLYVDKRFALNFVIVFNHTVSAKQIDFIVKLRLDLSTRIFGLTNDGLIA